MTRTATRKAAREQGRPYMAFGFSSSWLTLVLDVCELSFSVETTPNPRQCVGNQELQGTNHSSYPEHLTSHGKREACECPTPFTNTARRPPSD